MATGIIGYGVYLPRYRIKAEEYTKAWGTFAAPGVKEKALTGYDEDVATMAIEASQNAIHQARAFMDAIPIDGIILAKLDSSSKGGMAFAIQEELKIPILFAGLGEGAEDIQPFCPDAFINGILNDR